MGARVVIVSFAEEKNAEQFVRLMDRWELDQPLNENAASQMSDEILAAGAILAATAKVEAVVARPTVFCRCPTPGVRGKNQFGGGYSKTVKFGWFVHAECRKPSYPIVKNYIVNMLMPAGNNLLPGLRDQFRKERDEALALGGSVESVSSGLLGGDASTSLEADPAQVQAGAVVASAQGSTTPDTGVLQREGNPGVFEVPSTGEGASGGSSDSATPGENI